MSLNCEIYFHENKKLNKTFYEKNTYKNFAKLYLLHKIFEQSIDVLIINKFKVNTKCSFAKIIYHTYKWMYRFIR